MRGKASAIIQVRDQNGRPVIGVAIQPGDSVYGLLVRGGISFTKIYRIAGAVTMRPQMSYASTDKMVISNEAEPSTETPPPPPPPVSGEVHTDVLIVKQRYYPEIPWTWKIDPVTGERRPAKLEVNYTQLSDHDNPNDTLKGDTIEVRAAWFAHMKKIQDQRGYTWVTTKHSWWFNRDADWKAELITAAGCVHVTIGENPTHWQIQGQPWDRETASLDPAIYNWWERPWEWSKVSAHNMTGQMFRVGRGDDGYAPLLQRKPKLWIAKVHAEKFRAVPFTVTYQERELVIIGYILKGASVYGRTSTGETIPLLLARTAGERIFTTLQWAIQEQTTVPAKAHPV